MLTLVLTEAQTQAVKNIKRWGVAAAADLSVFEWNELIVSGECWYDGILYRAHETYEAPGEMCKPDALGRTTQEADWQFEDTQHARFEDGSLQI